MHFAISLVLFLSLLTSTVMAQSDPALAQGQTPRPQDRGLLSYIDFGGSSNADGRIFTLGFTGGYKFSPRLSVTARLPFYFTSFTTTTASTTQRTTLSDNGIGNPSLAVRLSFPNHILDYRTRVTTWLPLTGTESGFSTGRILVDWTSRFSRQFGRVIPFGEVAISNTVPDTRTFLRPFTSLGFNARLEGGTDVELTRIFSAGGSYYKVLPSGQQHMYSRFLLASESGGLTGGSTGGSIAGGSMGTGSITGGPMGGMMGNNVFLQRPVTTGADLTRDHGFSTWLDVFPSRFVDLELGYTRSFGYELNNISFGVGFNLGAWARRHGNE